MNRFKVLKYKMNSDNNKENMKEEKIEINTNQIKEGSEDRLIKKEKNESYDKFKNRMKLLFLEFEKEDKNNDLNITSAINFKEKELNLKSGCFTLLILLIIILICILLIIVFSVVGKACYFIIPVPGLGMIISFILLCNFVTIPPGFALVLTYYGKYLGTCKNPGYYWVRPCSEKSLISMKSAQFNGTMIKVNDKEGSPVLLGVVSVYRINDTVKATYGVKNSDGFMKAQTESAIRFIANKFSYDSEDENEPTLKSGNEDINTLLKLELQRRTKMAGIIIEDARITEISYGNEIASLMLQKQAADAIINSKAKIAKGAVDIIDNSIKELERRNVCRFNDEEKSRLVGNMMIVLNMDKGGNAIINVK